jgi:hypothetical protein
MKSKEEIEEEINQRFENKGEKIKILEWNGAKGAVKFQCLNCNKVFKLSVGNALTRKNRTVLCLNCNKNYATKAHTEEVKHKIDYLLNTNKNLLVLKNFTRITESMTFQCKNCGGIFDRKPSSFLLTQKCPICESRATLKTESFFKKELKEKYGDEYKLIGNYVKANEKTLVQHNCGFIYSVTPHNLLCGKGCPKCNRHHSKGERKIEKYLTKNNITFLSQYVFQDSEIKDLSFDFFVPGINTLIEYQGEQHYSAIKFFGGEPKFAKQQKNDNRKREYCKKVGIDLLEISYLDFQNIDEILMKNIGSTTIM